jgi:hypothetical protein
MVSLARDNFDTLHFGYDVFNLRFQENGSGLKESYKDGIAHLTAPFLVTTYLPIQSVEHIAEIQELGFQFIECRVYVTKEIRQYYSTNDLYPFSFQRVNDYPVLNELLKRSETMDFDDRYSCDPRINKGLALKRNLVFLEQSFQRDNEPIFILKNEFSEEILGFRSFRLDSDIEVSMLLCGVLPNQQSDKYLRMINSFELEALGKIGVQYVNAVLSARNYSEVNRYIAENGFQIEKIEYVCRKISD